MKHINIMFLFIVTFFWLVQPAYSSTALGIFVDEVLENNPAIQAAKANVAAANARKQAAGFPLYNPELVAEKQNAIEDTNIIGINQTIDWTNKRGVREQVSSADVSVAKAQFADIRQQIEAKILSALANYQALSQAVSLAKERTSLLKKFAALAQKRYDNGDISRVDLDLAQLALSEGLAQQADIEVRANQALQILREITGFNRMNWPRFANTLPILSVNNIAPENFISKLPAVLILNNQYRAAFSKIKVAERAQYPDPTISLQGGNSSDNSQNRRLIGLTVSIPLFVRNPYRAEVDAANYDAMEAGEKRLNIVRQAKAEIESSAERYQALYRASQQWQQISNKPLSDGMPLVERLWQAGEINTTDYVVQLKQRVDSQIAGAELKGRAWEAWADWLKASGQIERWLQIQPSSSWSRQWA